jgi:hypothetical protein
MLTFGWAGTGCKYPPPRTKPLLATLEGERAAPPTTRRALEKLTLTNRTEHDVRSVCELLLQFHQVLAHGLVHVRRFR